MSPLEEPELILCSNKNGPNSSVQPQKGSASSSSFPEQSLCDRVEWVNSVFLSRYKSKIIQTRPKKETTGHNVLQNS